jgi:hypothetical protein
MHSCNARAEDGVGISDVNCFDRTIFNGVASHHSLELSIRGVAGHGLSFASKDGIFNLALGEPFVAPDVWFVPLPWQGWSAGRGRENRGRCRQFRD